MPPLDTVPDIRALPVHFSHLKRMALSPAHYRASVLNPRPPSAAMRFGTLVHTVLLGGDVRVFDGERRGKAWLDFREANAGADIVTVAELERANRCAEAIHEHPGVREYGLLEGDHELHVEWSIGGRACSSRLDILGKDFVADLKTTTTVKPEKLCWHAAAMSYHAQLDFYREAARFIGRPVERAFIVAVETQPPFAVTVLRLTPATLEQGRRLHRLWWEQLRVCEDADAWPGYAQMPVEMNIDEDAAITIEGEEMPF